MHAIDWKTSRNQFLYILQIHIHNCGNASSLKNLDIAKRLTTITSSTLCSQGKKRSWLRKLLWFHAFKFPRRDSLYISHSQIIGPNSQFNKRTNLRQVQTNHESMMSDSLCECPRCESAQHQHGESLAPWPLQHTSSEQSVFTLRQHKSTKNLTSTISLSHLFVLNIDLTPDNVICYINLELENDASLQFILVQ